MSEMPGTKRKRCGHRCRRRPRQSNLLDGRAPKVSHCVEWCISCKEKAHTHPKSSRILQSAKASMHSRFAVGTCTVNLEHVSAGVLSPFFATASITSTFVSPRWVHGQVCNQAVPMLNGVGTLTGSSSGSMVKKYGKNLLPDGSPNAHGKGSRFTICDLKSLLTGSSPTAHTAPNTTLLDNYFNAGASDGQGGSSKTPYDAAYLCPTIKTGKCSSL